MPRSSRATGSPSVRWTCRTTCRPAAPSAASGKASCARAISPTAAARRASRVSSDPSALSCSAPWVTAAARSRASARSSSAVTVMVPAKETCSSSMVTCRPSAPRAASSAAPAGSNLAIAASTSRSTAVADVRCANGASWASTYAAASGTGRRGWWSPRPACARQAGRSPACTRRHNRGSRCRSSRACPTRRFADTVEIPRTAPSSLMQNSATNGAPTPATGSSCSPPPGMTNAAADSTDRPGAGPPTHTPRPAAQPPHDPQCRDETARTRAPRTRCREARSW